MLRGNGVLDSVQHGEQQRYAPMTTHDARVRRVLVVDDEPLIRWSLGQALEDGGFAVEQASNAAEALRCAAGDGSFDIVFLDFRLPDSDDLTLLARMRQALPAAVVILMTAYSTPEVAQGALDLGAARVISKPFEIGDIIKLVAEVS
jgi:DNA-binding NtrC family response regulator